MNRAYTKLRVHRSDGAELKVYPGGGHGLPDTDRDRLHANLLDFINA